MTDKAQRVDAWMPLWIGDYLADTMTLTTVMHGAYLLLLFAYWRNRGPLLDDDEELAAIVKASRAEWKHLRPKLLRFFKLENGCWNHGRADAELADAGIRKTKAVSKAKTAADARWGKSGKGAKSTPKSTAPSGASSDAPSMLQALPKDVLEDCPSPSPLPAPTPDGEPGESVSRTHAGEGAHVPARTHGTDADPDGPPGDDPPPLDPDSLPPLDADPDDIPIPLGPQPTPAGAVGLALRRAGMQPNEIRTLDPRVQKLIAEGVTPEEIGEVAKECVDKGRGSLGYVVTTLINRRAEAAALAVAPKVPQRIKPTAHVGINQRDYEERPSDGRFIPEA